MKARCLQCSLPSTITELNLSKYIYPSIVLLCINILFRCSSPSAFHQTENTSYPCAMIINNFIRFASIANVRHVQSRSIPHSWTKEPFIFVDPVFPACSSPPPSLSSACFTESRHLGPAFPLLLSSSPLAFPSPAASRHGIGGEDVS